MTSSSGSFRTFTRDSLSLESGRVFGGEVFHPHEIRPVLPQQRTAFSIDVVSGADLTLGFLQYSSGVHIETSPLEDCYHVNVPLDGELRTAVADAGAVVRPHDAAAYNPGARAVVEGWDGGGRVLAIKVGRDRMRRTVERLLGPAAPDLVLDLPLDLHSPQGKEWLTLLKLLLNARRPGDTLASSAGVFDPLADAVVSGLVLLGRPDATVVEEEPADPRPVETVCRFMDDHADQTLTMGAIAAAGGMSVRTMQARFRDELGTTPHEYLRSVRLTRVHEDLRRSTHTSTTVAQVARRWGFGNLGRFAAHYAAVYDETPMATLRSSTV